MPASAEMRRQSCGLGGLLLLLLAHTVVGIRPPSIPLLRRRAQSRHDELRPQPGTEAVTPKEIAKDVGELLVEELAEEMDAIGEWVAHHMVVTTAAIMVVGSSIFAQTVHHHHVPGAWAEWVADWARFRAENVLPITTVVAFFIYSSTDMLSQVLSQRRMHDPNLHARIVLSRVFRVGTICAFLSGFLCVYYYRLLELISDSLPVASWTTSAALQRVLGAAAATLFDVVAYEPFYDSLYLSLNALIRRDTLKEWIQELRKVPFVWKRAPFYWVPIDMANLLLVPMRLRPLVSAIAYIPWSMFLTTMANDVDAQKA